MLFNYILMSVLAAAIVINLHKVYTRFKPFKECPTEYKIRSLFATLDISHMEYVGRRIVDKDKYVNVFPVFADVFDVTTGNQVQRVVVMDNLDYYIAQSLTQIRYPSAPSAMSQDQTYQQVSA